MIDCLLVIVMRQNGVCYAVQCCVVLWYAVLCCAVYRLYQAVQCVEGLILAVISPSFDVISFCFIWYDFVIFYILYCVHLMHQKQ